MTPQEEVDALEQEIPALKSFLTLNGSYIVAHRNEASRQDYEDAKRISAAVHAHLQKKTRGKNSHVVIMACFLVVAEVYRSFIESKQGALLDARKRATDPIPEVLKH